MHQLFLLFLVTICSAKFTCAEEISGSNSTNREAELMNATNNVRLPAVAGLFYPKAESLLRETVEKLLKSAEKPAIGKVRAIISPHAGYEYSGPVAAVAYNAIPGQSFKTVFVLGPSHYARFKGVSVCTSVVYKTPLGSVPISARAKELAKIKPFVPEPHCMVYQPSWARIASRPLPLPGEETPETWEHSVEVQIPFLQVTLKNFELVSLIYGEADPEDAAKVLADFLDDSSLLVVSSDLSHYLPYSQAVNVDKTTIKWICEGNTAALAHPTAENTACGRMPILALMYLAKIKGWEPKLLSYKNSGDTAGDKSAVVGYAAIAYVERSCSSNAVSETNRVSTTAEPIKLSPSQKKFLLQLARKTLCEVTASRPMPKIDPAEVDSALQVPYGCFVTLKKGGELRGCIGNILPDKPLYEAVIENARNAALYDFRFPPVTPSEVPEIKIEISVLSKPEKLQYNSPEELLRKLQPHKHGVVLRIGSRVATFLPQVWEQLPDPVEFLSRLSMKAGCPPDAWKGKDTTVEVYTVTAFEEE